MPRFPTQALHPARPYFFIATLLGCLISFSVLLLWLAYPPPLRDFDIHWVSARLTLAGLGSTTYDEHQLAAAVQAQMPGNRPYMAVMGGLYPPFSLLLTAPLGLLPYSTALLAFTLIGVVLMLILGWQILGGLGILIVLGSPALWQCVNAGQTSLIVSALLGLGIWHAARKPVGAGLALTLCLIKPQLAALSPLTLGIAGHWRTFVTLLAATLAILALSWLLLPGSWSAAQASIPVTAAWLLDNPPLWERFATPFAAFRRLGISSPDAFVMHAVAALSAIRLSVWVFRTTRDPAAHLVAIGLLTLWLPPLAYEYDMTISLLALLGYAYLLKDKPASTAEIGLWLTVYLLPLTGFFTDWKGNFLTLSMLAGLCLQGCLMLRLRTEKSPAPLA